MSFEGTDYWLNSSWTVAYLVPDAAVHTADKTEVHDGPQAFLDRVLASVFLPEDYQHLPLNSPRYKEAVEWAVNELKGKFEHDDTKPFWFWLRLGDTLTLHHFRIVLLQPPT
jgi:hypothetical protein